MGRSFITTLFGAVSASILMAGCAGGGNVNDDAEYTEDSLSAIGLETAGQIENQDDLRYFFGSEIELVGTFSFDNRRHCILTLFSGMKLYLENFAKVARGDSWLDYQGLPMRVYGVPSGPPPEYAWGTFGHNLAYLDVLDYDALSEDFWLSHEPLERKSLRFGSRYVTTLEELHEDVEDENQEYDEDTEDEETDDEETDDEGTDDEGEWDYEDAFRYETDEGDDYEDDFDAPRRAPRRKRGSRTRRYQRTNDGYDDRE